MNPLFILLGADAPAVCRSLTSPARSPGLLIQPLIGAMSDKTWSPRWGKRKPFVSRPAPLELRHHLVPLPARVRRGVDGRDLPVAGGCLQQHGHGALPGADLRPAAQGRRSPAGFLTQSMFTGAGAVLANVSLFVMQKFVTAASLLKASVCPTWVFICLLAGIGLLPWVTVKA